MGVWDSVKQGVSRPVRGIGRVLRGNVREGLGDIGAGAKFAAPILAATGVGAPLAIGIGAAGGALERAGERGAKPGNVIGNALRGGGQAAVGAAVGHLGGKAVGALRGAAPVAEVAGSYTPAMAEQATSLAASSGVPRAVASAAPSVGTEVARQGIFQTAKALPGAAWNAATSSPQSALLTAKAMETGMNAYGAYQQGRVEDEERRRRDEQARLLAPLFMHMLQNNANREFFYSSPSDHGYGGY